MEKALVPRVAIEPPSSAAFAVKVHVTRASELPSIAQIAPPREPVVTGSTISARLSLRVQLVRESAA